MAMELEPIRGFRMKTLPVTDDTWVDYEELYEELFSRAEQSVGAQLRPTKEQKNTDGDEQ